MTPLKSELAAFIEKNLIGSERKITVDDKTPLIEEGIIDSMGTDADRVVSEERAGVRVPGTKRSVRTTSRRSKPSTGWSGACRNIRPAAEERRLGWSRACRRRGPTPAAN